MSSENINLFASVISSSSSSASSSPHESPSETSSNESSYFLIFFRFFGSCSILFNTSGGIISLELGFIGIVFKSYTPRSFLSNYDKIAFLFL